MKRVLTAAVLVPLIVWLIFGDSFWLITLVVGIVAELALWEYLTLADASGAKTPRGAAGIAVAALFALTFFRPELLATLAGAITLALLIPGDARWRRPAIVAAALLSFLSGLSRPMLGVHYPSDVIAGWCFGLFWVLLLVRLTAAPLRTPHLS